MPSRLKEMDQSFAPMQSDSLRPALDFPRTCEVREMEPGSKNPKPVPDPSRAPAREG